MNPRGAKFRRLAGGLEDELLLAIDSFRGLTSRDIYGRLTATGKDVKTESNEEAEERSDYQSEPPLVREAFDRGWD